MWMESAPVVLWHVQGHRGKFIAVQPMESSHSHDPLLKRKKEIHLVTHPEIASECSSIFIAIRRWGNWRYTIRTLNHRL
jgi:hypothetical protein